MHPRLRFWIIVSLGIIASIVAAVGIAEESYMLASLISAALLWCLLEWRGAAYPEAWILAGALAGYVLANRGFAQFSFTQGVPLLPAEFALGVGGAAVVLRMAFRATAIVHRDALNFAILVWMALGVARLWPDIRVNGMIALRDFATVYYAGFFYLAQGVARHDASQRLLRNTLLIACAILPLSYFLFSQFGGTLMRSFTFRGAPLVFYKDDLVAAYLFGGFFLAITAVGWPTWLRLVIAGASYATAFSINSSRAAIVGLVLASMWWAVARRWIAWRWQGMFIALGIVALGLLAVAKNEPFHRSRVYALYEHIASMVDVTGTGRYSTDERLYVGDNNRFRLVWWRSVAQEVWATSPVFGLGFGADLTSQFIRNYDLDLGEEFVTRSPHSVVFTVLGRMGLAGLIAWLAILAAMAARTFRLAQRARNDDTVLPVLGWWSLAWVVLGSACFGVVLEGPMGAVVFWTTLGMANASTFAEHAPALATSEAEPAPQPEIASHLPSAVS